MADTFRFGRRVPLPSTRQIKHDLLQMQGAEKIAGLEADLKAAALAPQPQLAVKPKT